MLTHLFDRLEKYLGDGTEKPTHYIAAVFLVAATAGFRYLADPIPGSGFATTLFYPAIFVAAWYGGFKPGLVATLLATFSASYFVRDTPSAISGVHVSTWGQLGLFAFSGGLSSLIMGMMHHLVNKIRQSHRDLSIQHEWYRVTLKSIGDAVMVTDRNGQIKFMNAEAERLSGWVITEAKDRPLRSIFRIINEESRTSVDDPVEKVFRENRVVGLANHTLLVSKDGTEWPIEDSAAPVCDDAGKLLGVVLVFHDATESRRGQRALKIQAEELEAKVLERTLSLQRTVTELETFSYTVSHDLRSPLRAMLGYATALIEDYSNVLPAVAKDYLERIARAAERLDHLIQDLLAFSRYSKDNTTVSPVDLNQLLSEILHQYPEFHRDKVDITIEGSLPSVLGHDSALTQVFSNLLNNGIKFVAKNRRPAVRIRAELSEHIVRIWFEDNGIGIARENFSRIFKIFEQINEPGLYSGTGVGLALVKKSVERMQGKVGVESELGLGSRFWVDLIRVKQI